MKTSSLDSKFIKTVLALILVFSVLLAFQVYIFSTTERTTKRAVEEGGTITVLVGEMYFKQEGFDIPRNTILAEVGDVVAFYNEGSVPHTVTIEEFDFDEVINPGETTFFEAERVVERASVNCRFHIGHEATLTVVERGELDRSDLVEEGVGLEDMEVRKASDRVERLEYKMVDGVKEFHLTAEPVLWEYAPGVLIESWGYNGQIPGPEIRVTEGDDVRIVFTNDLPEPTSVHWHGLDVPFAQDGVPGVTQDPIMPGESFVYEFTATPAGTRFYHTHGSHHGDEALQMDMGLAGAFVIEPEDYQDPDREYTLVLSERTREGVFPINGRIYPDQEELLVSEGDRVRIRMINAGSTTFHPMHLHGHQFEIVAIDGNPVPLSARQVRNTQTVHPGETYDIEFTADNPGVWLFHCHELQHAAGGMIATVVYEDF